MKALIRATKQITGMITLEDKLAKLMEYGCPHLHCHDSLKWSCNVKLNTDKVDIDATVRSGYNHPTPNSACDEVLGKLA